MEKKIGKIRKEKDGIGIGNKKPEESKMEYGLWVLREKMHQLFTL